MAVSEIQIPLCKIQSVQLLAVHLWLRIMHMWQMLVRMTHNRGPVSPPSGQAT